MQPSTKKTMSILLDNSKERTYGTLSLSLSFRCASRLPIETVSWRRPTTADETLTPPPPPPPSTPSEEMIISTTPPPPPKRVCEGFLAGTCSRSKDECHLHHGKDAVVVGVASSTSSKKSGGCGGDNLVRCRNPRSAGVASPSSKRSRCAAAPQRKPAVVCVASSTSSKKRCGGGDSLVGSRNPSSAGIPGPPSKRSRRAATPQRRLIKEVCKDFIATGGTCPRGEQCWYMHSWIISDSYSLHIPLEGHRKAVTGVALLSCSDRLFSGSQDGTLRVWDCHSGECMALVDLGGPVGCMVSEEPWVLAGIPGCVKAWNTQTGTHLSLNTMSTTGRGGSSSKEAKGQVYSLAEGNGFLFAGTQGTGDILAWKFPSSNSSPPSTVRGEAILFEPAPPLVGHQGAVVSLTVAPGSRTRLYSGSIDTTIRVWDLTTLQCLQTLTDHIHAVTSLLCWDSYLLSCSLDRTIKAWALSSETWELQVIHTRTEEDGLLALCGLNDPHDGKPVLLCSCNDNILRLYDLPKFTLRGKIFSKREVRAIATGPGGQFFTGDASGYVKVWKHALHSAGSSPSSY